MRANRIEDTQTRREPQQPVDTGPPGPRGDQCVPGRLSSHRGEEPLLQFQQALAAGALDVYATPIQMKKNRPAIKVTCVCATQDLDTLAALIFRETTTIGIRYTIAQRKTLRREFFQVQTSYGAVTMKISLLDGRPINFIPEFEDCRRLAAEKGVALKEVQAAAICAYLQSKQ